MATFQTFRAFNALLSIQPAHEASAALGREYWVVTEPFVYYIGVKGSSITVEIPAGYLTDGATVPSIASDHIKPWGKHGQACVLHDRLCEYLTVKIDGLDAPITRSRADKILLEAMEVLGVSWTKRNIMYLAVCAWRIYNGITQPKPNIRKREWEALYRDQHGIQPAQLPLLECQKIPVGSSQQNMLSSVIREAGIINAIRRQE